MAPSSLGRTRAFSLRAPIANEQERADFQRRVGLISLVLFLLAGLYWLINLLSLLAVSGKGDAMWSTPAVRVQLATTLLGLALWLFLRGRALSARALDIVDALSCLITCLGWGVMTAFTPARVRPDLIGLLACTLTLVMRAALVPSTPVRSALLSAGSLAPLVVITHFHMADEPTFSPLHVAVYTATWGVLAVGAATTTTWVTYGLRLQVRKAMQLGQYLLEDKLGEGGMGTVYRASHAMLRRPTAIKLLSRDNEHAVERFEREVQITARLTHPNTIAIYDYGRTPDGVFYYAMEYLDGISLEDLVEATGAQPVERVVHILLQICGALREAHGEGLVHRDIKPANLMLTARGGIPDFVKVLDFGLVKETASVNVAVTQANAILGTPHYMAPEAILDPETIDRRADIYALGATAYFLLTGERVFDGTNIVEVCGKHVHEQPMAPSSRQSKIDGRLDDLILACLAKKPQDRPSDAAQLIDRLQRSGVGPWTEETATTWWRANANVVRPQSEAAPSNILGTTIAVAVDDRVQRERR